MVSGFSLPKTMDWFNIITILLCVFADINAQVLQCPSCTYVNTEADVPGAVRTVIDTLLNAFQEPKCSERLTGPIPEIKMETCAAEDGKIAMCSYYDGTVDVEIDIIVTSFNIPMRIYQQGCYSALSANPPSVGCHDRKNINEDRSTMKKIIESASSLVEDVVSFEGQLCVCTDSYCKETSGAKKSAGFMLLLLAASVSALLLKL